MRLSRLRDWFSWQMVKNGGPRERLVREIAWRLPRGVAYWAFVRVAAAGTTGRYGDTHPDSLSVIDAMKRWGTSR